MDRDILVLTEAGGMTMKVMKRAEVTRLIGIIFILTSMISCSQVYTPQAPVSKMSEPPPYRAITPIIPPGKYQKYEYKPVGAALGKSCIRSYFRPVNSSSSYLEAIKKAVDSKKGDMLADPVVEQSVKKNLIQTIFGGETRCVNVYGVVLKIVLPDKGIKKEIKNVEKHQIEKKEGEVLQAKASGIKRINLERRKPIKGRIVEIQDNRMLGSKFDEVIIDKGRAGGIWIGDRLAIRKNPDSRYRKGERGNYVIGFLKIVSTTDDTATGVITVSSEEVTKDDIVESIRE